MATQFTPGPWWIDRHGSAFPLAIRAQLDGDVDSDTGQHIVVGGDLVAAMPDGDEANAHLIASAPELYAELQQFVNGVETGMIDSPADETLANITHRAKTALAKARGESVIA